MPSLHLDKWPHLFVDRVLTYPCLKHSLLFPKLPPVLDTATADILTTAGGGAAEGVWERGRGSRGGYGRR